MLSYVGYLFYTCTCVLMSLYLIIIVTTVLHSYLILSSLFCIILNNQNGRAALHIATEGGHVEVVKLLLDKGANVEAITVYVSH